MPGTSVSTTGALSTVVGPNTKLTYAQIEGVWIQAGGDPKLAPLMAAIAMAESGGHPFEINDTPSTGDYSVGLWQINYYNGLAQSRTAAFGTPEALRRDPLAQARAAISLSKSQGLSAWTTYTRGTYQQFLQGNVPPDTTGHYGSGSGATGSTTTAGNVLGATVDPNCLIPYPTVSSSVGIGSGGCLITRDQARKLLGGMIMVAGGGIMAMGVLLLVGIAFRRKGKELVQTVSGVVPYVGQARRFINLAQGAGKAAAPPAPPPTGGRTTVNVTAPPAPTTGANPPKGPASAIKGASASTRASAARLRKQGPTVRQGRRP